MIEDKGSIPIEQADDANIPVVCFMYDPNKEAHGEYLGKWVWTASNFMPRKEYVAELAYLLVADSKEEILAKLRGYVIPLYERAINNLKETGQNYYWK